MKSSPVERADRRISQEKERRRIDAKPYLVSVDEGPALGVLNLNPTSER
jgi:hypothetical protein